jgi:phospholipid/cholesterol/gamma-HCH transport system permease protein
MVAVFARLSNRGTPTPLVYNPRVQPNAPSSPDPLALIRPVDAFGRFAGRAVLAALREPLFWGEVAYHIRVIGSRCLGPVLITIVPFGMVLGLQGMNIFAMMGAQRLMSGLVTLIIVRELAPVLAAVLTAAQGGATYAAELGAMRIKEELDATEVMAVDPMAFHVVPRVLAMVVVNPVLTILAILFGVGGGYIVAVVSYDQASGVFLHNMTELIGLYDILAAVAKAIAYGLFLGLLSTFQGFQTTGGAEGVGRAVNNTVVYTIVFLLVFNYAASSLLFGWR